MENKLHVIKTQYKPFAKCEEIRCLCGDIYKEHKIETMICCSNCGIPLTFGKFTITVVERGVGGDSCIHPIGICEKCNGIALEDYTEKESILSVFNNGTNTFTVIT